MAGIQVALLVCISGDTGTTGFGREPRWVEERSRRGRFACSYGTHSARFAYSLRSASTGSMRAARRAGRTPAANPTVTARASASRT